MTVILSILGSMYRLIFVAIFICVTFNLSYSQYIDEDENNNPDESGLPMPNIAISDEKPIDDVAEGSGTIRHTGVSIREKPSLTSKVLRSANQSEKVLILGEDGDWYHVRMYNNREGYVHKRYVRTARVFRDESATTNSMDKTASFEIIDIIDRFNNTLKNSPYAKKFQVVPELQLVDARKSKGVMTLTFIYSCVNLDGKKIPSLKRNDLQNQMINLLELIFARLILTETDVFNIIIMSPNFNEEGNVTDLKRNYAEITFNNEDIKLEDIKENISNIWKYIDSDIDKKQLFVGFPSM